MYGINTMRTVHKGNVSFYLLVEQETPTEVYVEGKGDTLKVEWLHSQPEGMEVSIITCYSHASSTNSSIMVAMADNEPPKGTWLKAYGVLLKKTAAWQPNERANPRDISALGDTTHELQGLLSSIPSDLANARSHVILRNKSRQTSVALRKLLQSNLLQKTIRKPRYHHLTPVKDTGPLSLRILGEDPRDPDYKIDAKLEFHSLPGWTLSTSTNRWEVDSRIFNVAQAPSLSVDKWLRQPLLAAVDWHTKQNFTLGDILSYVANKEGAHVDWAGKAKLEKYLEAVNDSESYTYPHWVNLFVAAYICCNLEFGMNQHPNKWEDIMRRCIFPPPEDLGISFNGLLPFRQFSAPAPPRSTKGGLIWSIGSAV